MARILVTGGAGFIGSYVCAKLLQHQHDVHVLDALLHNTTPLLNGWSLRFRAELLRDVSFRRVDLRDRDAVQREVTHFAPEYVIHLAALARADVALQNTDEAFGSILTTTHNLLEAIRGSKDLKNFVYISSSMVYGDFEREPIQETCRTEPKEIYGSMKLAGEFLVKAFGRCFDIPFTIVRPSAVYGPGDINQRVIGAFLTNAIHGKPLVAQDADSNRLDFTYVEDIADGVILATLSPSALGQTFNITCGQGRSLREVIDLIKEIYPSVQTVCVTKDAYRPRRGTLDISRAREVLGYEPRFTVERGLPLYATHLEAAFRAIAEHQRLAAG